MVGAGKGTSFSSSLSRFEQAAAALRVGGTIVLFDEQRNPAGLAVALIAALGAEPASPSLGAAMQAEGLVLGPVQPQPARLAGLGLGPLEAVAGGVLVRPAIPEAAADLAHAAGIATGMVVSRPHGLAAISSAEAAARVLAERHGLFIVSIQDVAVHRLDREVIVQAAAVAQLPTLHGDDAFDVHAFRSLLDGGEHLAMVRQPSGAPAPGRSPLVRLHSECLTGDALGSLRCDCGDQLRRSLALIAADPSGGALIYLRGHEGRGIGLVNKIRAYALQDQGLDTVEANEELGFAADRRDYGIGVQILTVLGLRRLRLLSNNPRKAIALERHGIEIAERIPLRIGPNPHNAAYLTTKRLKLGHDLTASG